jgi:hypothetical protein
MMGDLLYDLLTNPASQALGLVFAIGLFVVLSNRNKDDRP